MNAPDEPLDHTPAEHRASMTWAQRLNRLFMWDIPIPHPYESAYGYANRLSCRFVNIDIETCLACGGAAKVIACIEDPVVIEKIVTHLNGKADIIYMAKTDMHIAVASLQSASCTYRIEFWLRAGQKVLSL